MILYLTWGKSFSRFFVKYLRMLVVVGGDGWVHRYGAGSLKAPFFRLVAGGFHVEFVSFYDIF